MRILIRLAGATAGAALALLVGVALVTLLSGGDAFLAAFLLFPAGLISLLVGSITGGILGPHAVRYFRTKAQSDSERRKRPGVILAIVLSIPAVIIFVIWFWRQAPEPPSDAVMLKHFGSQETTLATLVQMANADKGLDRVDENWTLPADTRDVGVSPERLTEYRKLLRNAGTPRGFQAGRRADGNDGVNFLFWLTGSAISDDTEKGFAYRTVPPANILPALDGIRPQSRNGFAAYRHIQGNWYLFYEFIPD